MAGETGKGAPRRRRAKADPAPTTPDPIEIAMEAEASGRAPAGQASLLLADQRRLIRWQIASERAGFALRVLTGFAGLGLAIGLGAMAWTAAHDESLVVRPFRAPPSWTARGLGGEVLAARYMDNIVALQQSAARGFLSIRALRGAGDEVRLEIPQTGVSLGDLQALMTAWLGRRKFVSGDLSEGPGGQVTLTVRVEGQSAISLSGPPGEVDAMMRQLAERSFAAADPLRATLAFSNMGRPDEALLVAGPLLAALEPGSPDLPTALVYRTLAEPDTRREVQLLRRAIEEQPTLKVAWYRLSAAERRLGHEQQAMDAARQGLSLRDRDQPGSFSSRGLRIIQRELEHLAGSLAGDYAAGANDAQRSLSNRSPWVARGHDAEKARYLIETGELMGAIRPDQVAWTRMEIAQASRDWPALLVAADDYAAAMAVRAAQPPRPGLLPRGQTPFYKSMQAYEWDRIIAPMRAVALAGAGRIEEARALTASTPPDCVPCLRASAEVESMAGNGAAADALYAKALGLGPRVPMTEAAWARSLLARGDTAGAAAKAAAAVAKGPRFADPLELWGEALLAQGDAKTAAVKFADAAKLAPRWGRLHLKWGEALAKLGKAEEARAQWRAAATMDLTAPERAALKAHGI